MYPFDMDDDEIDEEIEETEENFEYEIDLETGRLTGRILTGVDAIKQWVKIMLSVDRYKYTQYSWDYGCELDELIGQGYDEEYIESEALRMIEEALSINEDITGISDFKCQFDKDKLIASFRLETIYGEVDIDV